MWRPEVDGVSSITVFEARSPSVSQELTDSIRVAGQKGPRVLPSTF